MGCCTIAGNRAVDCGPQWQRWECKYQEEKKDTCEQRDENIRRRKRKGRAGWVAKGWEREEVQKRSDGGVGVLQG